MHPRHQMRLSGPASPHENGDIEQRHHRFYRAVDQALMLRGHRDFVDQSVYAAFLETLLEQLNAGRRERLNEELVVLRQLPARRMEDYKRLEVRVSRAGNAFRVEGVEAFRGSWQTPPEL